MDGVTKVAKGNWLLFAFESFQASFTKIAHELVRLNVYGTVIC
jgi:hypothetical protein